MKKNTNKKTPAEIISEKFIDKLEKGTVPWVKPWIMWESWSRASGKDYKGTNMLLLSGGEYVTFKQVVQEGGKVNKGVKSEQVINYTEYTKDMTGKDLTPDELIKCFTDNGKTMMKLKSLRYYNVFNISQTNLEQKHDKELKRFEWDAHKQADELAESYISKNNISVDYMGNEAYEIAGAFVKIPSKKQFSQMPEYYSTLFHELIHTTSIRLKRNTSNYNSSKKARAREELVAEIGAAYIMSYLGIETEFTQANSAAYMKSYAKNLKDDTSAILYAAPKAIEAAELIINSKTS